MIITRKEEDILKQNKLYPEEGFSLYGPDFFLGREHIEFLKSWPTKHCWCSWTKVSGCWDVRIQGSKEGFNNQVLTHKCFDDSASDTVSNSSTIHGLTITPKGLLILEGISLSYTEVGYRHDDTYTIEGKCLYNIRAFLPSAQEELVERVGAKISREGSQSRFIYDADRFQNALREMEECEPIPEPLLSHSTISIIVNSKPLQEEHIPRLEMIKREREGILSTITNK